MRRVPHECPATTPCLGDQVDRECVRPDLQARKFSGLLDHCPHHFPAGGIAQRMDDPVMAVPSFATEIKAAVSLVKPRSPADQFTDPRWCLPHDRVHHILMAEAATGGEGVGDVVIEAIFRIDDACDPALRPLAG